MTDPAVRTPPGISLRGLTKRYAGVPAVDALDLEIAPGSLGALLGPSGCGKSTTLGLVAGLRSPDAGDVLVGGRSVVGVPVERRPVGLVSQKPLLFPHLDVADNVGFGLRMRRLDRRQIGRRVSAMLDRVQLGPLAHRRVGELSGGQEQRVALARALVLEPAVLLLDEPFSQLDPELRTEMRALVRSLHDESALTTVFVTHDQAEAVEVADTISLLLDGRLAGSGRPELFYRAPPSLAAARFFGVVNELPGVLTRTGFRSDTGSTHSCTGLPGRPSQARAVLVIRPEAVQVLPAQGAQEPGRDLLPGRAVAARFAGTHLVVEVEVGGREAGRATRIRVHRPLDAPVPLGSELLLRLPPESSTIFPVP